MPCEHVAQRRIKTQGICTVRGLSAMQAVHRYELPGGHCPLSRLGMLVYRLPLELLIG